MDTQRESIRSHFGALAVQYYVAGRAAAIHQLIPVMGNLLHHAVEMALKAALASSLSLEQMKRFRHELPQIWNSFSAAHSVDAPRLEQTVAALHRFEELRYPDSIVARGALIDLALFREHVGMPASDAPGPRYSFVLEDVDELMEFIFAEASINPRFFTGAMLPSAKEYLSLHNRHSSKW